MFRVASVPGSLPIAFALILLHPTFALAEVAAGAPPEAATSPEQRTAQELEQIRADPLALRAFSRL